MLSLLRKHSNLKSVGYQLQHVTPPGTMEQRIDLLKSLFLAAVDSVKPKALFETALQNAEIAKQLQVPGKRYHVVGFGKAVIGMAVQMECALGDRLTSGCISIPVGTSDRFKEDPEFQLKKSSKIQIYECARNNLPDDAAAKAAKSITSLAESMTSEDILCVLVSGGGSALLPLPKAPVTLEEKLSMIKLLASAGASIDELNLVRILLSDVKGGKLALAAKNSYKTLSFIISDIVGDPIPLIASGPTVKSEVTNQDGWNILVKYNLVHKMPKSVESVLSNADTLLLDVPGEVHLIGSNKIAIESIVNKAQKSEEVIVFPLSSIVQGNVAELCAAYTTLANSIIDFKESRLQKSDFTVQLEKLGNILNFDISIAHKLVDLLSTNPQKEVILVAGGEPTVIVKGSGLGGRNQELALRFSVSCHLHKDKLRNVILLSAGTDGIDGPTDAAGAVGASQVVKDFKSLGLNKSVGDFIDENDSYAFYRMVNSGKYHIKTGHTGTNVMDIHILWIPGKRCE